MEIKLFLGCFGGKSLFHLRFCSFISYSNLFLWENVSVVFDCALRFQAADFKHSRVPLCDLCKQWLQLLAWWHFSFLSSSLSSQGPHCKNSKFSSLFHFNSENQKRNTTSPIHKKHQLPHEATTIPSSFQFSFVFFLNKWWEWTTECVSFFPWEHWEYLLGFETRKGLIVFIQAHLLNFLFLVLQY